MRWLLGEVRPRIGFLRIPEHVCRGEKKKKKQTYLFVHRQMSSC